MRGGELEQGYICEVTSLSKRPDSGLETRPRGGGSPSPLPSVRKPYSCSVQYAGTTRKLLDYLLFYAVNSYRILLMEAFVRWPYFKKEAAGKHNKTFKSFNGYLGARRTIYLLPKTPFLPFLTYSSGQGGVTLEHYVKKAETELLETNRMLVWGSGTKDYNHNSGIKPYTSSKRLFARGVFQRRDALFF